MVSTVSTPLVVDLLSTCQGTLERIGRRWLVVSTIAFELYQHTISKMNKVDGAKLIASNILEVVQHGSYSHFIYVEVGSPVSKVDKLLWMILKGLLADVEDNVVALIVNTKWPLVNTDLMRNSISNLDQDTKVARKVRNRFRGCKFFMYLDLPALNNGNVPDVLEKKVKTREYSLNILENTLCSSVTPRAEISIDNKSDQSAMMSLLASFLEPVAEVVKRPNIRLLKELDPLSKLSKKYKELSTNSNKDKGLLARPDHSKNYASTDSVEAKTSQLVVGSSNMSHIYLEMEINVAPLESIYVEVDSHDQGWSSYKEDQGNYRNSWTWGELSIMDHGQDFKEKTNVPHLRVYTNLHASSTWQLHKKYISCEDPEDKKFLDSIQNGDKVIL